MLDLNVISEPGLMVRNTDDLETARFLLKDGADIQFYVPDSGLTICHVSCQWDNSCHVSALQMKLILMFATLG